MPLSCQQCGVVLFRPCQNLVEICVVLTKFIYFLFWVNGRLDTRLWVLRHTAVNPVVFCPLPRCMACN